MTPPDLPSEGTQVPEDFELSPGSEVDEEDVVDQLANRFPQEIRRAVEGIDGDTQYAILVALFDEGRLSFSELQEYLDVHQQTLSNALQKLQQGALISRRNQSDLNSRYESYYIVSDYGEQFVEYLFRSLEPKRFTSRPPSEFVEDRNIHGISFQPYERFEVKDRGKDRIEGAEVAVQERGTI